MNASFPDQARVVIVGAPSKAMEARRGDAGSP